MASTPGIGQALLYAAWGSDRCLIVQQSLPSTWSVGSCGQGGRPETLVLSEVPSKEGYPNADVL
ncbi:MAG TPA: hypothetical protein VLL25_03140, partial [Acidimicrobiales bacterium]|nr:hypothetical protein [Acidimicrobiales bacterium]